MLPLKLYLDSSDFSVLSDSKRQTSELLELRDQLQAWVREGKLQCVFSGTHLSEMAPLETKVADAAERRANLLADLCGRNAVVSQDVLFADELRLAYGLTPQQPSPFNNTGDWFPAGTADTLELQPMDIGAEIRGAIDRMQLNRAARRKAASLALRNGKLRAQAHKTLKRGARHGSLEEILKIYPMRPDDARTIGRYVFGDADACAAREAFLNSLRDPHWMMQWFRQHHERLTPFLDWVRSPAKGMLANLQQMSAHAELVRRVDKLLDQRTADELFSSSQWVTWQDDLLISIAHRLAQALLHHEIEKLSVSSIDRSCPGLACGIRSLHSAWWTVTSATPRKPKLSDFPDALHAMYAPYVDVFRADSFMAPYIARYSSRFGTTVVAKLADLKPKLESLLAAH